MTPKSVANCQLPAIVVDNKVLRFKNLPTLATGAYRKKDQTGQKYQKFQKSSKKYQKVQHLSLNAEHLFLFMPKILDNLFSWTDLRTYPL